MEQLKLNDHDGWEDYIGINIILENNNVAAIICTANVSF